MIAVLINQHSLPLSSVQGITIMNTMKQQLCGDLVICTQVGAVPLKMQEPFVDAAKVAAVGIQG